MDISVDLDMAGDAKHTFTLAYLRLATVISEERERVIIAGRHTRSRCQSRADGVIAEILEQVER